MIDRLVFRSRHSQSISCNPDPLFLRYGFVNNCLIVRLLGLLGIAILAAPTGAQECMQWVHRAEVSGNTQGPGMQFRHCMAYHPGRGTTILFSADEHANLWEYNGTNWALVEVVGPKPRARMDAGLAYSGGFITLVGGYAHIPNADGSRRLEDIWTFQFEGEDQTNPVPGAARGTWTLVGLLPPAVYRLGGLRPRPQTIEESGARSDLRLVNTPKGLLALGGMAKHRIQPDSDFSYDDFEGPASFLHVMNGAHRHTHLLSFFLQGVQGVLGGVTELATAYDSRRKRVLHHGGVVLLSYESSPYVYMEGSLRELELRAAEFQPIGFHAGELASLPPRYGHRMVYDSRRDRLVAFGGSVLTKRDMGPGLWQGQLQDASRYFEVALGDNTVSEPAAGSAPSARWGHDMVFDERRGVVVLYGGFNSLVDYSTLNGLAAETWELVPVTPQFAQQPQPLLDLCATRNPETGEETTPAFELTARLSSPGPTTYQWHRDGKILRAPTTNEATLVMPQDRATFSFNSTGTTVAGTYVCHAVDACGNSWWSQPSEVRVFSAPTTPSIFLRGVDSDNTNFFLHLCPGDSVAIEAPTILPSDNYINCAWVVDPSTGDEQVQCVVTNGPAHPVSLQWFRFGANLDSGVESLARQTLVPGATNETLNLPNITPDMNGYYRLQSRAECGVGYSAPIEITAGVWIKASPRDQTNQVCDPLALRVAASGKGVLRYQWRKNGMDLPGDLHIFGTTNATLNFTRLRYLDDAAYDCVISDDCNTVTSRVARVTVTPNPPFVLADTTGPAARHRHGMVYDSVRGVTVLFGGLGNGDDSSSAYLNDTWEYDGTNWTRRATAVSPSSRIDFGLAFDRRRGRVVLFGGASNLGQDPNGETWEYDGANWVQKFPMHSPAPRRHCALFYDPIRSVATLYGGETTLANPRAGDVWTWDGTDWTERVVTGERPPFGLERGSPLQPRMVWDERRGYAVMPPTDNPVPGGDFITWTWDGAGWTSRPYTFAGFGYTPMWVGNGLGVAYDHYRGEVIYWAGDIFDQEYIWRWNGTDWRHDANDPEVGFLLYAAAAYDERRHSLVLFGGIHSDGDPSHPQGYSARTYERILADEPILLRQPAVITEAPPAKMVVRVVAAGAGPLAYQWQRDGVPLSEGGPFTGVGGPALAIDQAAAGDPGRFRCVVVGRCGSVTSEEITLAPPSLLRFTVGAASADGKRSIILEWSEADGMPQSAPAVNGPWSDIPTAQSPWTVIAQETQLFFRLWKP